MADVQVKCWSQVCVKLKTVWFCTDNDYILVSMEYLSLPDVQTGTSDVTMNEAESCVCLPDVCGSSNLPAIIGLFLVRASGSWEEQGAHLIVDKEDLLCFSRMEASSIFYLLSPAPRCRA